MYQMVFKNTGAPALQVFGGLVVILILYWLAGVTWNLWFHPLSKYPGPKLWAVSKIPQAMRYIDGKWHHTVTGLHEKYGDQVRIGPDQLSFSNSAAFRDILALKPGRPQLRKDPLTYHLPVNGSHSILTEPSNEEHARHRRLLAHGFSERAMREQEATLKQFVDLFIKRLHEHSKKGPVNIESWFNWTTFDVIGDLTFDESFGCLEKAEYHPWIKFIFGSMKGGVVLTQARRFPLLTRLIKFLFGKKVIESREKNLAYSKAKVDHRLQSNTDRLDFLAYVIRHDGKESGLSRGEIDSDAVILMLGGSETTATLLSATTFRLTTHPRVMKKLVAEIRGKFANEDDITISAVNELAYMLAVLDEGLRITTPVPLGSPRIVPPEGHVINGQVVPGGTTVTASAYAASHISRNFKDPYDFVPERWQGDDDYSGDDRTANVPFSMGPRNCIGRNLAYAEMRLVLARLLWNFDLELMPESKSWDQSLKFYLVFEKGPLMVKLTPVKRET